MEDTRHPVLAVQVDKTCLAQARGRTFPPFLRHVLKDRRVQGGRVHLVLVLALSEVPSRNGVPVPVGQASKAAVRDFEKHLRDGDLGFLVQRMRTLSQGVIGSGSQVGEDGGQHAADGILYRAPASRQGDERAFSGGGDALRVSSHVQVHNMADVALCRAVKALNAQCLVLCSPSEGFRRQCFVRVAKEAPACQVLVLLRHQLHTLHCAQLQGSPDGGALRSSWGVRRLLPFSFALASDMVPRLRHWLLREESGFRSPIRRGSPSPSALEWSLAACACTVGAALILRHFQVDSLYLGQRQSGGR